MDRDFFMDKLTKDNMDNYFIRRSIFRSLQENIHVFSGKLLDSGCGKMPYREYILKHSDVTEYIGLDIENSLTYDKTIKPDFFWDGKTMPFDDNSFDCILSTEVMEHCSDFNTYIQENIRVLKPGGYMFFTVPFLWPLHETPGDNFRYTPFALQHIFKKYNTSEAHIFALGGWNASLATMIGLWANRYLSKKRSKYLKPLLLPVVRRLIKKDKVPTTFEDNTMITGLYGYVKKSLLSTVKNIALIAPSRHAYSETFIQMHKRGIAGNVVYYYGGEMPVKNEISGSLSSNYTKIIYRLARQFSKVGLSRREYELYRSFKKEKISSVVAEYGTTAVRVLSVCKKMELPLIPVFHGYDAHIDEIVEKNEKKYRQLFLYAKAVVAVSHRMSERLQELGCPVEKITVTPCAPDNRFFKAVPDFALKNCIAIGRFVEKKAPQLTIQAFSKVIEKYPDAMLYMVGAGPLLDKCTKLVTTLQLKDNVHLLGIKTPGEILELFEKSSVYIQHSVVAKNGDSEGTPVSILEAQAAGLPVVSTRHAGIKDVIIDKETGFLVDEFDVDGMADKIVFLLENPERAKEMGEKGRNNVKNKYSEKIHLNTINEIIYS